MQNDKKQSITRKDIRSSKGDSFTQYKVAKAETKKLIKRDKPTNLTDDLNRISNLPLEKRFFLSLY